MTALVFLLLPLPDAAGAEFVEVEDRFSLLFLFFFFFFFILSIALVLFAFLPMTICREVSGSIICVSKDNVALSPFS